MSIPHDNRTIDDQVWDSPEFDTYVGMVALDDKFVEQKGLPRSQRFPWDSSKGIYIFHGYHSLHCVVSLSLQKDPEDLHTNLSISSSSAKRSCSTARTGPRSGLSRMSRTVSMFSARIPPAMLTIYHGIRDTSTMRLAIWLVPREQVKPVCAAIGVSCASLRSKIQPAIDVR